MRKNYDSDRVREIFDLTLELAGITPGTVKNSKSESAFWDTILKLWKEKENVIGCNIMYASLFRVHWGCWLKKIESNMKVRRLCELVVKELLERKDVLKQIKTKRGFTTPYNAVMKSHTPYSTVRKRWKSERYAAFLKDRMNYILYGGEREIEKLDLVRTGMAEIEEMKTNAMTRYRYDRFTNLVMKLIPESNNWHLEDWANENKILEAIQLSLGIDLRNNSKLFDDIIYIMVLTERSVVYDRGLLCVEELPFAVAKIIWPENTERTIEVLFQTAYLDCKKYLARASAYSPCSAADAQYMIQRLKNSWLYTLISEWNENGTFSLESTTKKCLFSLGIGV